MNYLPADNPKILEDLTRRKEFFQFSQPETEQSRLPDGWVHKYDLNDLKEDEVNLEPQSYQSMVSNFLNPTTPYSRLLLKWDPGMGKTIAALNIAMQFIRLYERESQMEDQNIGSVFVIGFTEEIFKRDLLSFPKFGFISRDELKQLQTLREAAHHENKTDVDRLQEFMTRLKKRLGSRKENGYFRFFGYKAFVNRIFMLQDFKRNLNDMSEDEIRQSLKDGSLKWNRQLLESFRNSLVICDEIHNVYNSLEKNNWGVALQMVLDQDPTIKAVLMSATPINNNPTEVVDLGNLVQPPYDEMGRPLPKLQKEDFFDGKDLKKGALERIVTVFRGKVSFIQDTDPRHFASQHMVGDDIPGIPYLKFQRCPMSSFHYETYKKVYTGVLAQDAQYLMDIAFPNPQGGVGLYRTNEIKRALAFADEAWTKKFGFKIMNDIIVGPGLEEGRIGEWSSKMAALLKSVKSDLIPHGGKILIYHDVVHVSGVLFIEQLLAHNGFIGIDQNPTESTLCAVCGRQQKEHRKTGAGRPIRIEAGGTKTAAAARALYRRVRGADLPSDVAPCTTRVAVAGDDVVAVLQWWPEDAGVTRIDALAVAPEWKNQKLAEDLMQHLPDTVITTIVPESDAELYRWYAEHYFHEHDRADGNIYMNYTGDHGAPEYVADAVLLQSYRAAALAPRYEDEFMRLLGEQGGYVSASDPVTLLLKGEQVCGYLVQSPDVQVYGPREIHPNSVRAFLSRVTGGGRKTAEDTHEFQPTRYIVAHSDMDKNVMHKHIDRFNSPDNTWGYQCRIIVGSKIIKESYNFKAIRKVKVTARPANIATLIQILGRSRRKKAHLLLPPEYRTIECRIFTSCLPIKERVSGRLIYGLSHEETKYREKMADFQIIQSIEQRIHENAIDAVTSRNIVLPGLDRKHPGLGALWFEPAAQTRRRYTLKDLNLNTFSIFHSQDEIRMLIYIIKRLFVEYSLCFTYEQLWAMLRAPPFHVEQDCSLFQEDYFVIALSMLVYETDRDTTVRPVARAAGPAARSYLLDILHEHIDKRIMQPDRTLGYVHHIQQYYIFVPFRNDKHDIYAESTFRTFDLNPNRPINIMRYIKDSSLTLNYENQKLKFKSKYENVPLERLATAVGKFGVAFHQAFVEEVIKYIFTVWTSPAATHKSEMHEFYFKMLYYYDLMGLIVWAATAKEFIREMYKPYILPLSALDQKGNTALDDSGEIHQLEMSLNRSRPNASVAVSKSDFTSALKKSLEILHARAKKKEKAPIVRADAKVLVIGHFMSNVPRFYHPDKDWFESPEYVQRTQAFKENDIIVGYYEKSGTGLRVKFKIRTPIHKIEKHRDIRMIEKGSICTSNSKEYLIEVAKKLKIKVPDKINVHQLCQEIEERLQLNELDERRKKSDVKWFYPAWEAHEGKRLEQSIQSSSRGGNRNDVIDEERDRRNINDASVPVDEWKSGYIVPIDEFPQTDPADEFPQDDAASSYIVPLDDING